MRGTVNTKVGYFNVGDVVEVIKHDEFGVLGTMKFVKNLTQNWVHWIEKCNVDWE